MSADEVFKMAVAAGCQPVWYDGICGPAWHCDCEDLAHAYDSQCSVVKFYQKESRTKGGDSGVQR